MPAIGIRRDTDRVRATAPDVSRGSVVDGTRTDHRAVVVPRG